MSTKVRRNGPKCDNSRNDINCDRVWRLEEQLRRRLSPRGNDETLKSMLRQGTYLCAETRWRRPPIARCENLVDVRIQKTIPSGQEAPRHRNATGWARRERCRNWPAAVPPSVAPPPAPKRSSSVLSAWTAKGQLLAGGARGTTTRAAETCPAEKRSWPTRTSSSQRQSEPCSIVTRGSRDVRCWVPRSADPGRLGPLPQDTATMR